MTSWLAIFGWFLVATGVLPALLLAGMGIVEIVYTLWLHWQARGLRARLDAIETASLEVQTRALVIELEEFLENQP